MFIVVEGNIGAGKTSLVHLLCQRFGATPMLEEFADNTFLPRFYENPDKFAFPLELSFLAARYQQMSKVFEQVNEQHIISDYHFEKCRIFASVNLHPKELELFDTFHNMMAEKMIHPDLIIFLNSDVKRLERNISKRGRPYEKAIESNYLDKISKAYTRRINTMEKSKVLIINSSELDFVNNNEHLEQIIKQISINLSM
ncbi:MAG: deoxynucleoside kinase [Bacteroidota bacterium]